MPQISPNKWKCNLSFFWWRQYADGRIEQEFDQLTGQIRPWGSKTPADLKSAGWLPVTADLARKMQSCGEFGTPTHAPAMLVDLKQGDELVIFKESTVYKISYYCKACKSTIQQCEMPETCPMCGASAAWKCDKCGKLLDADRCSDCEQPCRLINPIVKQPISWEETIYCLGIKGKFTQKFTDKRSVIS